MNSEETIYFAYDGTSQEDGAVTGVEMVIDAQVVETLTDLVEKFRDFCIRLGYHQDLVEGIKYDHDKTIASIVRGSV